MKCLACGEEMRVSTSTRFYWCDRHDGNSVSYAEGVSSMEDGWCSLLIGDYSPRPSEEFARLLKLLAFR